jgi:hypothetical protein
MLLMAGPLEQKVQKIRPFSFFGREARSTFNHFGKFQDFYDFGPWLVASPPRTVCRPPLQYRR